MASPATPVQHSPSTGYSSPHKRKEPESDLLEFRTAAVAATTMTPPSTPPNALRSMQSPPKRLKHPSTAPAAASAAAAAAAALNFDSDGDVDMLPRTPDTPSSAAARTDSPPTAATPEGVALLEQAASAALVAMLPIEEGFTMYGVSSGRRGPPPAPRRVPAAQLRTRAHRDNGDPISALTIATFTAQELAAQAAAEQKAAAEKAAREAVTAKAREVLGKEEIVVGGQCYTLTDRLGQGDTMETWATNVPGKVVKRFHPERIRFTRGDALELLLREGAQNFCDLQALGIPVAGIDNLDTIAGDMVIVQDQVQCFREDEEFSPGQLREIQRLLKVCYDKDAELQIKGKKLAADMFKKNFGILNGAIVFCDFFGEQTPFHQRIQKYLESFAQGNGAIYNFLDPRPPASTAKK